MSFSASLRLLCELVSSRVSVLGSRVSRIGCVEASFGGPVDRKGAYIELDVVSEVLEDGYTVQLRDLSSLTLLFSRTQRSIDSVGDVLVGFPVRILVKCVG